MNPDLAYANADFIPDAARYPEQWAIAAAEMRARLIALGRARLDLPYGPAEREKYDLFLPDGAPLGLMVFVHGGYWRAFGRSDWSHLASGALARGWAVAMPSYTLAPAARIAGITRQIARAIAQAAEEVGGPVVLTGHSAGGHLAARMNCKDVALASGLAGRLRRIVPISPLSDLRPLLRTQLNADLRLDAAEAEAESPLLHRERHGVPVTCWVGAEERPAFLDQARWLTEGWEEANLRIAPGRHHFDVIELLEDPNSAMTASLLAD